MAQNLIQKWSKLSSKMMKNAIPPGSELFRDFFLEKWVVRASGAHYSPHAARERSFLLLASSIWGCGHETMARASREKFLWKELFFKATGRLRPAFKKSSFPRNIERIKNVLKCIETLWKARKIDCHRMLRTLRTTFCTTRCKTVLFSIHFHQKMVWAPSKMGSGKCQKWSPKNHQNGHQTLSKLGAENSPGWCKKITKMVAKKSPG